MELVLDSVIPKSWFRASPSSSPIGARIGQPFERVAPLTAGERTIGPFVLPSFQRPPVWTQDQKVRFIESCWLGLPIGSYTVNMGRYGSPYDLWLLDGQQRVTAIVEYMANQFSVFGYTYAELPERDIRAWDFSRVFVCMETQIENEAELREVYDRLAYGGTAHEPRTPPPLDELARKEG